MAILVLRIDDREAGFVEFEMTFDERQHATPDRTKADHHDRAGNRAVHGPLRHLVFLQMAGGMRAAFSGTRRSRKLQASGAF